MIFLVINHHNVEAVSLANKLAVHEEEDKVNELISSSFHG